MNLRNKDFMDILLGDKQNLAQRFADVDAEIVRSQMKKLPWLATKFRPNSKN